MPEKRRYSIGEIAELCGVSCKTLRYYDRIGLLCPSEKNAETQYRYYAKEQIFHVFLIRKLQALGFSLKEIQALLEADAPDRYVQEIGRKMSEIRQEIDGLERVFSEGTLLMKKLEQRRAFPDRLPVPEQSGASPDGGAKPQKAGIQTEYLPQVQVLFTRRTMHDYNNVEISVGRWLELFRLAEQQSLPVTGSILLTYHTEHPMEQFFKPTCELEVMLPVDPGGSVTRCDVKSFGGFRAATAFHFGPYDTISSTHLRLLRWVECNGFSLDGKISEEYVVSPMDLCAGSGYVTKIIAPIR